MQKDFFTDIERLEISDKQIAKYSQKKPRRTSKQPRIRRVQGEFLKGPIPLNWLSSVSKLKGKSPLAVALAIWFEAGRRKSDEINLTTQICNRFNVNRKAKYRALKKLEEANLIEVHRQPRKNPLIRIIDLKSHQPTGTEAQRSEE